MSDITKCKGNSCHIKETCYRYTAPKGEWQSYFSKSPVKDGKCEYYLKKEEPKKKNAEKG